VTDYAQLAAEIVEGLERGEFETMWERHAAGMSRGKDAAGLKSWWPTLDGMIGRSRRVTESMQVADSPPVARAVLSGETGEAVATLLFDEAGKITDIGVTDWPLVLGIGNIQIDCPAGSVPQVAKLYAELLGMRLPPEHGPNWVVIAKDRRTKPALPFAGQAPNWRAPSWGDPDRPQQVHLELFVRDMSEADGIAERHGATLVDENVWADQAGHAIRFCPGESGDVPGVIGRIVLDCFSPRSLALFYEELLDMTTRLEDTPELMVISHEDGRLPMLAFRHVPGHMLPRTPTLSTRSRCIWTSSSRTTTAPCGWPNGSARSGSPTPAVTRRCMRTRRATRSACVSPVSKEENMKKSGSTEGSKLVAERIAALGDWRSTTLGTLRRLIKQAAPDVVEEIKWVKATNPGVPTWSHDGIICTGESYKDKVKLTFAKGASLKDPKKLFNSSLDGNTRRAIDISEGEKIDADAFKALIRAAVALNSSRGKATPKREK
jgi:hypothetical protein